MQEREHRADEIEFISGVRSHCNVWRWWRWAVRTKKKYLLIPNTCSCVFFRIFELNTLSKQRSFVFVSIFWNVTQIYGSRGHELAHTKQYHYYSTYARRYTFLRRFCLAFRCPVLIPRRLMATVRKVEIYPWFRELPSWLFWAVLVSDFATHTHILRVYCVRCTCELWSFTSARAVCMLARLC